MCLCVCVYARCSLVLLRTIPNVDIPKVLLKFLGGQDFVFDGVCVRACVCARAPTRVYVCLGGWALCVHACVVHLEVRPLQASHTYSLTPYFPCADELTYPGTVPPYVTTVKSIPPIYPNKAKIGSKLTCESTGPDSCLQVG